MGGPTKILVDYRTIGRKRILGLNDIVPSRVTAEFSAIHHVLLQHPPFIPRQQRAKTNPFIIVRHGSDVDLARALAMCQ